jgi:hypothetical protein
MAEKWYFAREGKKFGPFSATQLKELAATEQLRPQDTVWKEGVEQAVLAVKVRHFLPPIQAKAPPAQPGGRTVPVPSFPRSPSRQLTLQPLGLATDSVPPSQPPEAQTTSPEPKSMIPDGLELIPIDDCISAPIVSAPPTDGTGSEHSDVPEQEEVKKRRVPGVVGVVFTSKGGLVVKYGKKCLKCGYADTKLTTTPIQRGIRRTNFICPRCKKSQRVEIQGVD